MLLFIMVITAEIALIAGAIAAALYWGKPDVSEEDETLLPMPFEADETDSWWKYAGQYMRHPYVSPYPRSIYHPIYHDQ